MFKFYKRLASGAGPFGRLFGRLFGRPFRCLCLCVCLCAVSPVPSFAADLLSLYREALQFDARISGARAAHAAGREALPQARARLLPSVELRGHLTRDQGTISPAGAPEQKTAGYTISLRQPLFQWDVWQGYRRGALVAAKADVTLAKADQELMLRVAQAYFEFLEAQHIASLAQAHRVAAAEQLAQATASVPLGNATIVDVHEATASHDEAVADEIEAQGAVDVSRSSLAIVVGRMVEEGDMPQFMRPLPRPIPGDARAWVALAEREAYAVQLGEITLEIARRETAMAYAGHMPRVDLVASRERRHTEGGLPYWNGPRDASQVGLQIQIPIFSGFAVQSRVRETLALADQALDELTEVRRTAGLAARKAHLGVTTGLRRISALEVAETSALAAFESNRFGYEHHVRPNVDVLNAQYKLYRVRRELAQARYRTLMESLKLKASTASLVESDIEAVSRLLRGV